jgi:hypothetical protein
MFPFIRRRHLSRTLSRFFPREWIKSIGFHRRGDLPGSGKGKMHLFRPGHFFMVLAIVCRRVDWKELRKVA